MINTSLDPVPIFLGTCHHKFSIDDFLEAAGFVDLYCTSIQIDFPSAPEHYKDTILTRCFASQIIF